MSRRLVRSLGYPEYRALKGADSLVRRILSQLGRPDVVALSNDEENALLFGRSDVLNPYLYSSLSMLAAAVFFTKDLYRRNNFDFFGISGNDILTDIIPSYSALKLKSDDLSKVELGDIVLGAAECLVEGIETEFYLLKDYDMLKSNEGIERFVVERAKQVRDYARLGMDVSKVMVGFGRSRQAGALFGVLRDLCNENNLVSAVRSEEQYKYLGGLIGVHALLNGLPFSGDVSPFHDCTGEEVTASMDVAKAFYNSFHAVTDFCLKKHKRSFASSQGKISRTDDAALIKKLWEYDWSSCILSNMTSDERMVRCLGFVKSPFIGLDQRLAAMGVPEELALNVSDGLSSILVGRRNYSGRPKSELYHLLGRRSSAYPGAVRELVRRVTGKSPASTCYKHFSSAEGTNWANAISPSICVSTKEGVILREGSSKVSSKKTLDFLMQQYSQDEGDICVRENIGACFVLSPDSLCGALNPKFSIIEVRDASGFVANYDRFAARLLDLEVDVHETVHAAQIGSRLVWRDVMYYIAEYFCNMAIKDSKRGIIDYEFRGKDFGIGRLNVLGRSHRDVIVEALDFFAAGCLGVGRLANRMRREGFVQGMWSEGIWPISDRDIFDVEVLRSIPLEKSLASDFVLNVRDALLGKDAAALGVLAKEASHHVQEISVIIESMAETFALACVKDYLRHVPDAGKYYDSLYSRIARKGVMANNFIAAGRNNALLRKCGLGYVNAIGDGVSAQKNLLKLGYDPIDPFVAYDDIAELKRRASVKGISFGDLLEPMNYAKATVWKRYSEYVPLFTDVIALHGAHQAFKALLEAESIDNVKGLLG